MKTKLILLTAILALTLGALPVSAGGPLIIWDPATQTPFAYFPGTVNIYTDLGGFGPLTNAEADVLTANGFAQWSAVPSSYFDAAVAGDFGTVGLPDITGANANLVVNVFNGGGIHVMYDDDGSITSGFFGAPPGVLGIASPDFGDFGTGELTESWAMLNGQAVDPADLAPIPGASFGGVFTHEFGHSINLAHTQTNGQVAFFGDAIAPSSCPSPYPFTITFDDVETMYPFLDPSAGSIGINMSTITQLDDIASVSNVYPTGGWPDPARTISGRIIAGDGVTELTGVNVIARNLADPFNDSISALSGDFTQGALGADGRYSFNGLTPGADYVVYVDQIVAGGFSTSPIFLPGPEEFYNGASESNDPNIDDECAFTAVVGGTGNVDILFNDDGSLDLGDDDFEEVALPFTFNFCGTDYNSVFVGSNGFVTFGSGDTDFGESVSDLLDNPPRIAPMWDDLSPNQGGAVFAEEVGGNFEVRWVDVPEFIAGNINTFTLTLRPDGTFNMDYGQVDALDGLVGTSPGALALDPGEIDVTAAPQPITGAPRDAVYELFSASDNDLGGGNLEWAACPDFEVIIANAVAGTCYGSTGAQDGGRLLTIDINTGAGTLIGPTGLGGMPGLAINSAGEIYGTERVSGDLYRVDAATGEAFFVASTGVSFMDGIAFDDNDVLYGIGFDPPAFTLWTIDVTNGAITPVGPTGDVYTGLTYDSTDGYLYASVGGFQPNTPDGIARIDKNTGAATVLGTTGFGGATPDIHAVDGVLYASKGGGSPKLIQVDKTNGSGTLVGTIGFASVSGLAYFAGDTTPPVVTVELNRDVLWPPNHKLVEICATVTAVDDTDPAPVIELTSITSDEPDNGTGDGDTANDIQMADFGTFDTKFKLRAERSGEGDGRKYTITYCATDAAGNVGEGIICVFVPHDQSGNAVATGGITPAGLEPEVAVFSLAIPSDGAFDATTVDPVRAYVGNQTGVVRPIASEEVDIDGDNRLDLLLTYSTASFLDLIHVDPGTRIVIGLHYTTQNDDNYLVKDLFSIQSIDNISRENRTGDVVADGNAGTSGQEYGMLFAGEWIEVDVFTVTGRKIRTFSRVGIPENDASLGWDGRDSGGRSVSGGIYFYRITTPAEVLKRKIVVVR